MSRLPLVLAIEPDLRQAAIVKRVVKERVQAEVVVVDSRDAAIAAINAAIPDVLLVSMLLSPRDEDDLIAHLRTLEGAAHLQTHTIPQLASALGPGDDGGGGGLFSAFRRKKQAASAPTGCDPDLFADEIRVYLQRAAEKKREAAESRPITPLPSLSRRVTETPAVVDQTAPPVDSSSWASPFEWRPSNPSSFVAHPAIPHPPIPDPEVPNSAITDPQIADPVIEDPVTADPVMADAIVVAPELEPVIAASIQDSPIQDSPIQDSPIHDSPIHDSRIQDSGIQDSRIQDSRIKDEGLRIHVPSPLSVWARKESPKAVVGAAHRELDTLFARLGVPDGVASVAYPEGVRIRRVRVRAAKEAHPSLHGAVLLGKRMLAELSGSDSSA